jgi:hypothetical protein
MKLHGDGVDAIATNVVTGGDASILQPQELKKAGGAAEARIDFEEDVIAAKEFVRDKRYAREARGAGEGNGRRLHENLAVMLTRKIQITGADVYRSAWAELPNLSLGSAATWLRASERDGRIARDRERARVDSRSHQARREEGARLRLDVRLVSYGQPSMQARELVKELA